jgi:hypothetical protein
LPLKRRSVIHQPELFDVKKHGNKVSGARYQVSGAGCSVPGVGMKGIFKG